MRTIRTLCVYALLAAAAAFVAGCGEGNRTPSAPGKGGKITVVTSIFPLADVARKVGGEYVEVAALLPPGQTPHGFEPKPRQAEALAGADVLVMVGLGVDIWAERLAAASGNRTLRRIILADLPAEHADDAHEHEAEAAHGHEAPAEPAHHAEVGEAEHDHGHHHAGGRDPHIWLDIPVMERYVEAVVKVFAELDPQHAAGFAERGAAYRKQLEDLDAQYRRELAAAPTKAFVSFHSAFGYIARRYGLKEVSLVGVNLSEAGPKGMEDAITFIRTHQIKTIFAEPELPADKVDALARQTGAKVARLDPLGNPSLPESDSYLNLMRTNLRALVDALKE